MGKPWSYQEYATKNRAKWETVDPRLQPGDKQCLRCALPLPRTKFALARNNPDGLQVWCTSCRHQHYESDIRISLLKNARQRARKNGLAFNLVVEDISIPEKCPVLGIPLEIGSGGQTSGSPSLDRKDNSRGYERGNVVVISWRANRIKGDASREELEAILAYVKSA